jgi:peroxiredoxin
MLSERQLAPDFQLPDLDGTVQSLASFRANGPVLIVFFKVSCPVCQLALPFLDRLGTNGSLQVLPISQDDAVTTRQFHRRFGIHLQTLVDTDPYPVSNAFGITTVPTIFLVETDGHISKAFAGFSKDGLEELGRRAGLAALFRAEEKVPAWKPG